MQFKCFVLLMPLPRVHRQGLSTKIGLMMKLTVVLLFVLVLQVSATTMAQTVTYTGKAVPLEKVFTAIRQQTGYKFFYRTEDLQGTPAVTLQLTNASLEQALKAALAEQPLSYYLEGKTVFISKAPAPVAVAPAAETPPGEVHGVVRDSKGRPIPGITVIAKHARTVTVSNEQGMFQFRNLAMSDTLMFSSVSYEPVTLPINDFMTVIMRERTVALSSVTVTYNNGYQVLSAERATGSFGKPDMKVFHERVGTNDLVARLEGQVAGLVVTTGLNASIVNRNGSGASVNASVLRGTDNTNGDQPLYVLNGVIVHDFSAVNSDDIEDITVLKDAAAAAIWGARASNGIIVVTTKSGTKNQRLTVSYSGYLNYQGKPNFGYQPMMNSHQFIQAAREIFDPVSYPYRSLTYSTIAPHDQFLYDAYRGKITQAQANAGLDSLASVNNWKQVKDLLYQPALTDNHSLSVSGGTNAYSFYATLGYTGTQSNTPGTKSNAYRIAISQDMNLGSRVHIGLNTTMINTIGSQDNAIAISHGFLPYQMFRDNEGNNLDMNYLYGLSDSLRRDYGARSRINTDYNPMNERKYGYQHINNLSLNATANIAVEIWKGIRFEGTYGYQKAPGSNQYYQDNKTLAQRKNNIAFTVAPTVNAVPVYYLPLTGGYYISTNNDQRNWTIRNQLVYTATPRGGKDALSLQAGQEAQEDYTYRTDATSYGYNNQLGSSALVDYKTLSQGLFGTVSGYGFLSRQPFTINTTLTRYNSYFALGNYTFNHKYSVDLNWRQDHSNLFGSDVSSQNKPTWSAGAKWHIAGEEFLQPVKWLNDLALRATYGITGNSPYLGAATYQDVLYSVPASQSGGVAGDALSISSPANRSVTWERTKTTNIGVDFAVLKRRISGAIEWYDRISDGLLASTPLNPFSGYTSTKGNLGKYTNQGIEITLHTQNIVTENFSWSSTFLFSYNKNKLVAIGIPNSYQNTVSYRMQGVSYLPGFATNPLFAYKFAGLDNMGDPQIRLTDKTITKSPTAPTINDIYYMGTTVAPYNGNLANTFLYKAFSFTANIIYNLGNVMRRDVNTFYTGRLGASSSFGSDNYAPSFLDRWKQPGDEAHTNIPAYVPGYQSYNRRNTDFYTKGTLNVVSASYAKLRDMTLAYTLPPSTLRTLKIQRMEVYVQTTNFMIWKANHDGIDPEYQSLSYGGRALPPYKHAYNVGLNLTF
ncbi:TonB-linked outer membrane protein, SusC/RagA family [Chitinophaga costaii]|uniref:TonB-linked outer membrane protein, SusC/RagA family n=2 Tax=Chitinophaga costaii TaxID=1335309 RepID=A0A1C4EFZ3_9BACT|nr:TonB-linked outer membrane protein, SusC/RagA family [Chitinophaga costaii]